MAVSGNVVMYLQRPAGAFWAWDEDARSVSFAGGGTVAFRQQFHEVVGQLSGRGLPPFSAIVLLLAACRGNWKTVGRMRLSEELLGALDQRTRERLLSGLEAVSTVPEGTWREPRRLAVLAQMVFERVRPVTTVDVAIEVAEALAADIDPEGLMVAEASGGDARADFAVAAAALAEGLEGFSAERLESRARTGLDLLPRKAGEEDVGLAGRVRALMDQLVQDPELSGVARLARNVLAAVHVPKLVGPREELAVGGVSDLSNHGPLDRLVLTELAYDDLTLAVRVAMNEALYVKREPPAALPPRTRVIVMDAGIRMWGTPRVFAAAVGMAMAASAERTAQVAVYRAAAGASADGVAAVELGTREGLVEHLAGLEPSPQPGAALAGVMNRHPEDADVILVTHPDAAADREFDRAVARCGGRPWYLVTVDRDGRFRMEGVTAAGRRPVREAVLDLTEILAGPPEARPATPVVDERVKDLPAIFGVRPFPLRLPYHPLPARSYTTEKGELVAVTTSDQRLLCWSRPEMKEIGTLLPADLMSKVTSTQATTPLGALQLSDRVPPGKLLAMTVDGDVPVARVLTVHGEKGVPAYYLMRARLDGSEQSHVRLATELHPVQGAAFHEGILYLVGREVAEMYRASTAARVGRVQLPAGAQWMWGRLVKAQGAAWVISYDGRHGTVTALPRPAGKAAQVAFEYEGSGGPLALYVDGTVRSLETSSGYEVTWPAGEERKYFFDHQPVVSPDGRRLAATGKDRSRYVLDVGAGEREWKKTDQYLVEAALGPAWKNTAGAKGVLRGMFVYVVRNGNGSLTLGGKHGRWTIELEGHDLWFRKAQAHRPVGPNVSFARVPRRDGVGYDLYVAKWPKGSKVFLDRRGLLHLKGVAPGMPEVTLVLASDGPMAGWSSDGKVFGPEYFHGQKVSWVGSHLDEYVRRFAEGLS